MHSPRSASDCEPYAVASPSSKRERNFFPFFALRALEEPLVVVIDRRRRGVGRRGTGALSLRRKRLRVPGRELGRAILDPADGDAVGGARRDGEVALLLVALDGAALPAARRERALHDEVDARARRAHLAVRGEPHDRRLRPWGQLARPGVAATVEVDPDERVVGGEDEPDAVETSGLVRRPHVVERAPRRGVGGGGGGTSGLVGHLRRLLRPGLVEESPEDPLPTAPERGGNDVEVGREHARRRHRGRPSPRAKSIRTAQGSHHVCPPPNAAPPGGPIHRPQRLQRGSQVEGRRAS